MINLDIKLNTIKFLSKTQESYKYIDKIYFESLNKITNSSFTNPETLYNIDKLTIESQIYLRKLIILCIDNKEDGDIILFDILSKTFRKAYKYVVSVNTIKMSSYLKKVYTGVYSDSLVAEFLAVIVFANYMKKEIDIKDHIYILCLKMLYSFEEVEKNPLLFQPQYITLDDNLKFVIDKIELKLHEEYFKYGYTATSIYEIVKNKDCLSYENGKLKINREKISKDPSSKLFLAYSYVDSLLSMVTMNDLFENTTIEKETVKSFILYYLNLTFKSISNLSISQIDFNELTLFISNSIVQSLYIKKYNQASKLFFENYSESLDSELKHLREEVKLKTEETLKLKNTIREYKTTIEEQDKKIDILENIINENNRNFKELYELRNYVFSLNRSSNTKEYTDISELDLSSLDDKKIICFGGNKQWIKSMKETFPNWTYISSELINFDVNILKDAYLICIKTTHMSHAMYNRIVAHMNKDTKIKFINNNNISIILNSLFN